MDYVMALLKQGFDNEHVAAMNNLWLRMGMTSGFLATTHVQLLSHPQDSGA